MENINDFKDWYNKNKVKLYDDFDSDNNKIKIEKARDGIENFKKDFPEESLEKIPFYCANESEKCIFNKKLNDNISVTNNNRLIYQLVNSDEYKDLLMGIRMTNFGDEKNKKKLSEELNGKNQDGTLKSLKDLLDRLRRDIIDWDKVSKDYPSWINQSAFLTKLLVIYQDKINPKYLAWNAAADQVKKIFDSFQFEQNRNKNEKKTALEINHDAMDKIKKNAEVYFDEKNKIKTSTNQKDNLFFYMNFVFNRYIIHKTIEDYYHLVKNEKNIILRGAPGTGKTYLANEIAAYIVSDGLTLDIENLDDEQKQRIEKVQFHPSYDYTDFVEGLRPVREQRDSNKQEISFDIKDGIFKAFVNKAKAENVEAKDLGRDAKEYVFIIDEINRGEISKIFGELFFAIDPGYRGERGGVLTQYSNMHTDQNKKFYIPDNVYIIGTMNDIDRSVDTFDFAMRRRFAFKEVTATDSMSKMSLSEEAEKKMIALNDTIIGPNINLSQDYQIGASYFINNNNIDETEFLEKLWENKLQPLLSEYFSGNVNTEKEKKLAIFKKAYNPGKKSDGTK